MAGRGLLYGEQELESEPEPELDEMDERDAEEDRRSWSISSAMGLSNKLSEGDIVSAW